MVLKNIAIGILLVVNALQAAQRDTIRVVFGGDLTMANHFSWHIANRYHLPMRNLTFARDADLFMVNLENPLTSSNEPVDKPFVFKAAPAYVRVLLNGGIDIVNLANNHIYDYGDKGLLETIRVLDEHHIAHVGAGANIAQARKPVIKTIRGVKIAFLGYYGLRPHRECHPATKDSAGTALRHISLIKKDVRALRKHVDYIVVTFHWGLEKENIPQPEQIRLAHQTITSGADVIIGHHPHVWQGIERYKQGLIAYSIGNFIFGGNSRRQEITALLQIDFPKPRGTIKAHLIPLIIKNWQAYPLNDARADTLLAHIKKYSRIFSKSGL